MGDSVDRYTIQLTSNNGGRILLNGTEITPIGSSGERFLGYLNPKAFVKLVGPGVERGRSLVTEEVDLLGGCSDRAGFVVEGDRRRNMRGFIPIEILQLGGEVLRIVWPAGCNGGTTTGQGRRHGT